MFCLRKIETSSDHNAAPILLLYLDIRFGSYFDPGSLRNLGLLQYGLNMFTHSKTFNTLVGTVIKMGDAVTI